MTDSVETVKTQLVKKPLTKYQIVKSNTLSAALNKNNFGFLNKKNIRQMMKDLYCHPTLSIECINYREKVLEHFFSNIDINDIKESSNVYLEIRRMQLTIMKDIPGNMQFELFCLIDTDGDGFITINELYECVKCRYGPDSRSVKIVDNFPPLSCTGDNTINDSIFCEIITQLDKLSR